MVNTDKLNKRKKPGRPRSGHYLLLALAIEKASAHDPLGVLDRKTVGRVLRALASAVYSCFDRADQRLVVPGLGRFTYRYTRAKKGGGLSYWRLHIVPDRLFAAELSRLLGRPSYEGERYLAAMQRRRRVLAERAESVGATLVFRNSDTQTGDIA